MSASGAFSKEVKKEIKKMQRAMKRKSVLASNALRSEALETLSQPGSGRQYRSKATRAYHTASAAGQPPAPNTGNFRDNWRATSVQMGNRYVSRIESSETVNGYLLGQLLENGTSKMAQRPYAEKIKRRATPKIIQIYSAPFV